MGASCMNWSKFDMFSGGFRQTCFIVICLERRSTPHPRTLPCSLASRFRINSVTSLFLLTRFLARYCLSFFPFASSSMLNRASMILRPSLPTIAKRNVSIKVRDAPFASESVLTSASRTSSMVRRRLRRRERSNSYNIQSLWRDKNICMFSNVSFSCTSFETR